MRRYLIAALAGVLAGMILMPQPPQSMPGNFTTLVNPSPYQFASGVSGLDGYEAVERSKARRSASGQVRSEDKVLDTTRRQILASNSMELHRNAILFAWALRRHLDYVTLYDFQPMTGDDALDKDLRFLMTRDCRPENCDIGGRHSWNRMRRLAEVRKMLDGDCGLLTLRSGHLQGIESHCIRNPRSSRTDAARWQLGVKLGTGRRAVAYCVSDCDQQNLDRERVVPASQLLMLAAFEGRFDQTRGISPVAGALNEFRDVYETKALMQAKVKLDQIFGVAFIREHEAGDLGEEFGTDGETEDETTDNTADEPGPPPSYDLGQNVKGFDLNTGEDLKLIHSQNPSSQTQEFLKLSIAIAIKALDLPFNFFDEGHTNFFGSRAAWMLYDRSCHYKREDQLELHRRYTVWRMQRWMLPTDFGGTGEIVLPRSMSLGDVNWKWVPRGMPWWNPNEELTVDLMAAAAGLKTLQQICDERGLGIWTDNLQQLQREFARAKELGFTLAFQPAKLPLSLSFAGLNDGNTLPEPTTAA